MGSPPVVYMGQLKVGKSFTSLGGSDLIPTEKAKEKRTHFWIQIPELFRTNSLRN